MPNRITISRYHDISCGHRVAGHEGKCASLHGHNYRITFTVSAEQVDDLGRVIDFADVKAILCQWLEDNWDHKFLVFCDDPLLPALRRFENLAVGLGTPKSLKVVGFNPTAENMAEMLLDMGNSLFIARHKHDGKPLLTLEAVKVEETRKCSATARKTA